MLAYCNGAHARFYSNLARFATTATTARATTASKLVDGVARPKDVCVYSRAFLRISSHHMRDWNEDDERRFDRKNNSRNTSNSGSSNNNNNNNYNRSIREKDTSNRSSGNSMISNSQNNNSSRSNREKDTSNRSSGNSMSSTEKKELSLRRLAKITKVAMIDMNQSERFINSIKINAPTKMEPVETEAKNKTNTNSASREQSGIDKSNKGVMDKLSKLISISEPSKVTEELLNPPMLNRKYPTRTESQAAKQSAAATQRGFEYKPPGALSGSNDAAEIEEMPNDAKLSRFKKIQLEKIAKMQSSPKIPKEEPFDDKKEADELLKKLVVPRFKLEDDSYFGGYEKSQMDELMKKIPGPRFGKNIKYGSSHDGFEKSQQKEAFVEPTRFPVAFEEEPKSQMDDFLKNIPGPSFGKPTKDASRKSSISLTSSAMPYWQAKTKPISLWSGNGLNIFTRAPEHKIKSKQLEKGNQESPFWTEHYTRELDNAQQIPAINGFDEMIALTKEGKLWHFPIDNEQGVCEVDSNVSFQDHIFLDDHLADFPQIESVQQFMSLAINGLSQNSFMSVAEKLEAIDWYKRYFRDKLDIINEAMKAEEIETQFRESIAADKVKSKMQSGTDRKL